MTRTPDGRGRERRHRTIIRLSAVRETGLAKRDSFMASCQSPPGDGGERATDRLGATEQPIRTRVMRRPLLRQVPAGLPVGIRTGHAVSFLRQG